MMLSPLKNISSSIKYIAKIFLLIAYLLIILFILHHHYVETGECALRVYYYPLDRQDYALITIIGMMMLSLSLYNLQCSKMLRAIEMLIYASFIIAILMWGDDILASRTIDWPESYKVEKL